MVNWPVVILFLLFPIYVVFRLESIARKLTKLERRQREADKKNIKLHNAQLAADQLRDTD